MVTHLWHVLFCARSDCLAGALAMGRKTECTETAWSKRSPHYRLPTTDMDSQSCHWGESDLLASFRLIVYLKVSIGIS
jgi:hypothetical protein